ncbi:type II secretion system protein [Kiritimatiellaeota bacterium B1221]|nr:type II secretion system protein [Kiritimatiellaeota bacterium B1221]
MKNSVFYQNPRPSGLMRIRRDCRGFTLIEMLVVIAIIALLASLIFPAVSGALERSKNVKCLSNMRQLGTAMFAYSTANKGKIMPLWIKGGGGVDEGWPTLLQKGGYLPSPPESITNKPPFFTKSPLYCPSGLTDKVAGSITGDNLSDPNGRRPMYWGSPYYDHPAHVWYGVNGRTWDPHHRFPLHKVPDDTNPDDDWVADLSSIRNPSKLVFAFDGVAFNAAASLARIQARHNKNTTTNLVFFDGHVASVRRDSLPMPGEESMMTASNPSQLTQKYPDIYWRLDQ